MLIWEIVILCQKELCLKKNGKCLGNNFHVLLMIKRVVYIFFLYKGIKVIKVNEQTCGFLYGPFQLRNPGYATDILSKDHSHIFVNKLNEPIRQYRT